MLTVVLNTPPRGVDRLEVASAHLQSAIVHINNAAQSRIPGSSGDSPEVDELRLIVVALADIINALRTAGTAPDPRGASVRRVDTAHGCLSVRH